MSCHICGVLHLRVQTSFSKDITTNFLTMIQISSHLSAKNLYKCQMSERLGLYVYLFSNIFLYNLLLLLLLCCCSEFGWSGLHHAASSGHTKCYHCLLQHGADQTLRNISGDTPTEVARLHGKPLAIGRAGELLL